MDCLELMEGIDYEVLQEGNPHRTVMGIEYDSRRIRRGYVFVCLRGTVESGVHFLKQAASDGAVMAVTQEEPTEIPEGLRVLLVEDVMRVMPVMASTYYHNPSQALYLAGVTGTNGKTTTTTLMYHIFRHAGEKTALVGTIENRIGALRLPAYNTTPQALDLQRLFRRMQDEGVKWAVMEVSSHALALHRVDALQFDIGVFTNLTLDHLDFHKTMEAYLEAKSLLFRKRASDC
ncbi:MAG: Mur ligase family protein [Clostridia bacterium]